MLQQVVFGGLLFGIRYAGASVPPAVWTTPTASTGDLKANTQDSVWLDWTSTYATPVLRMWCWDDAAGGEALASSFSIDNNGPFEYIMDSFMEPNKMPYPLSCQAELANGDADNSGIRCPVKIVWSLNESVAMKTVNAPAKTTTIAPKTTSLSPSSTTTQVQVGEPKVTSSTGLAPVSTAGQPTADSLSQSTANPTSGTDQSSTSSTGASGQPTTPSAGGSASDSNATTAAAAPTSSSSNNTGAIVGGVVGGIAVLSFIVFAFLFLRRQKRNRASYSTTTNESSIWNLYFFNSHKKEAALKAETGPVYEKEGSGMARELEANSAGGPWKANHTALYSPVEMPAEPNRYP
ncbi:hypothetical protein VE03_07231 [Pseudogymnoascus sp. 23342-1-I1]|nr:hypothetical protein VE03_07231 [Pseudogymnoascus sp. 23342-1-I1]